MPLFQPAQNLSAFAKVGFYGSQGSGKTFTASLMAIGLHKMIRSKKPVAFLDSETGSDFAAALFARNKVPLVHHKGRAFSVLREAMGEAQNIADVLIIDSISHFWTELLSAYLKKKKGGGQFIRIQDWGPIKRRWAEGFSLPYVNSKLHVIMCGRLANIFEDVEEDDEAEETGGKKQFKAIKVGTKMRSETETGYEPHLLIEMVKVYDKNDGHFTHRAYIRKDRNTDSKTSLQDQYFDDPTFDSFLPHIRCLNLGGEHVGVDTSRTSEGEFDSEGQTEWARAKRERDAALETVQERMAAMFGRSARDKQLGAKVLEVLFGSVAWSKEIEPDAKKHPREQCVRAAAIVNKLYQRGEQEPDWANGLTVADLGKWLTDELGEYESEESPKDLVGAAK